MSFIFCGWSGRDKGRSWSWYIMIMSYWILKQTHVKDFQRSGWRYFSQRNLFLPPIVGGSDYTYTYLQSYHRKMYPSISISIFKHLSTNTYMCRPSRHHWAALCAKKHRMDKLNELRTSVVSHAINLPFANGFKLIKFYWRIVALALPQIPRPQ